MKQALILVDEINVLYKAVYKTKSPYLKNDYCKAIYRKKLDLKEYCKYKNLNYKEIINMRG